MSAGADPVAPREVPAAVGSPLASLRERREQAQKKAVIDLAVPNYDPKIYVRYRSLSIEEFDRIDSRHSKAKSSIKALRISSAILATACVGVFEIDEETGAEVSIDPNDREGPWPKFDDQLAKIFEIPAGKADDVLRALYATEMHIVAVAGQLQDWCMAGDQELRRADQGE